MMPNRLLENNTATFLSTWHALHGCNEWDGD
jgi:hypothetical protein